MLTPKGVKTVTDDGADTVTCWRCGRQRYTYESCPHCGGSCKPQTRKKQTQGQPDRDMPGFFQLPDNCSDLFDLFLSPPVRQARQQAIQRIDQQAAPEHVKTVGKALVTIQSINAQAQVDREQKRRLQRNQGGRQ